MMNVMTIRLTCMPEALIICNDGNMKNVPLLFVIVVMLLASCGDKRLSPAYLQQKVDSVNALESERKLKMLGVNLEETSPFQMFYDSLAVQPLPLVYSEDYVRMLPNYSYVPEAIMRFLELEGREASRAIALPETLGVRLVLLAADMQDGVYELWLYSLDNECYPVDKLQLYAPNHVDDSKLSTEEQETYFSITSDYEIRVKEYVDENDLKGQVSCFIVDNSRMFVEKTQI